MIFVIVRLEEVMHSTTRLSDDIKDAPRRESMRIAEDLIDDVGVFDVNRTVDARRLSIYLATDIRYSAVPHFTLRVDDDIPDALRFVFAESAVTLQCSVVDGDSGSVLKERDTMKDVDAVGGQAVGQTEPRVDFDWSEGPIQAQ